MARRAQTVSTVTQHLRSQDYESNPKIYQPQVSQSFKYLKYLKVSPPQKWEPSSSFKRKEYNPKSCKNSGNAISLDKSRAGTFELVETVIIRSVHQAWRRQFFGKFWLLTDRSRSFLNIWFDFYISFANNYVFACLIGFVTDICVFKKKDLPSKVLGCSVTVPVWMYSMSCLKMIGIEKYLNHIWS